MYSVPRACAFAQQISEVETAYDSVRDYSLRSMLKQILSSAN